MIEHPSIPWPLPDRFVIGFGQGFDYSIDPTISDEPLAEFTQSEGDCSIRDLGGSFPVLLNGKPISGRTPILPGSLVQIANWSWTVPMPSNPAGITITLQDVSYSVSQKSGLMKLLPGSAKNLTLLKDINLQIYPGEFIGILGPSGAGKSTLLHVLNGDYSVADGKVWFDDQAADDFLRQHKHRLAYLPQEPIFHDSLTPRQALEYTMLLRGLPREINGSAVSATMLERVGLSQRADIALKKLSGGEKKRAALAVELLGEPSAVFLDEATSGLDPAREKEMMRLFRDVANTGKTVVCITHFPENLTLCDKLIVVAKSRVAFQGTPDELLAAFKIKSIEEVYSILSGEMIPDVATPAMATPPQTSSAALLSKTNIPGTIPQFTTLALRYGHILLSDPKNLLSLLLQAPVIAALIGVTFGVIAIDYAEQHAADWKQVAFLLVMSVVWCAGTNGVREIVKEKAIYQHERRYGLNDFAYILSKFIPLGAISVGQAIVLLVVLGSITKFAGVLSAHFIILALLALASTALGLCISSGVKTSEQAMAYLPVILIAQAVFSGGLARLTGAAKLFAEFFANAFWGLDGLKSTLPSKLVEATYVSTPGEYQPAILGRGGPLWIDAMALCFQAAALLWLCKWFLKIKRTTKNSCVA